MFVANTYPSRILCLQRIRIHQGSCVCSEYVSIKDHVSVANTHPSRILWRIRYKHRILDGYVFATNTGSLMDSYSLKTQDPWWIRIRYKHRILDGYVFATNTGSLMDTYSLQTQDPWWSRIRYKHRILDGYVFATNTGSLMDTYSLQTQDPWWIRIHYKHRILDAFCSEYVSIKDPVFVANTYASRILCL